MNNEFITYPELYERAKGNNQSLSENWKQYLFWLKNLKPGFFYDRVASKYGIETIKLSRDSKIEIEVIERGGRNLTVQLANPEIIAAIEAEARLLDYIPPSN
jgi:hypothetical protein